MRRFGPAERVAKRPPLATLIAADAPADLAAPRLFRGARVVATISKQAGPVPVQLRDNTSTSFGIVILPGYEPALPVRFTNLIASGRAEVLRLLGVRDALLSAMEGKRAPPSAALEPFAEPFAGSRLFRVREPLPRAYVAVAATLLSDEESLAAAFAPDVLDGRRALVADTTIRLFSNAAQRGNCRLERYRSDQLIATCSTAGPGLAVFVEQWAPGWEATVDGVAAPVVRANITCRAVPIPLGTHRVVLRYTPPGLFAGLTVSVLTALIILGCLL